MESAAKADEAQVLTTGPPIGLEGVLGRRELVPAAPDMSKAVHLTWRGLLGSPPAKFHLRSWLAASMGVSEVLAGVLSPSISVLTRLPFLFLIISFLPSDYPSAAWLCCYPTKSPLPTKKSLPAI